MITNGIINQAIECGGRGSWEVIKKNMTHGQDFYTTDIGKIKFIQFINNEKGNEVPIFRTKSGALSSYDYFYRELICKDSVFLKEVDAENKKLKNQIKRIRSNFEDALDFDLLILKLIESNLTVEVVSEDERKYSKILDVKDCFIGDNGNLIISVDDI